MSRFVTPYNVDSVNKGTTLARRARDKGPVDLYCPKRKKGRYLVR